MLLALGLASRLMVEGFVSHAELELFVLISLDRSFQSWIQLEVFALMKKYGSHFFSLAFRTHEHKHKKAFAVESRQRFILKMVFLYLYKG